MYYVQRHNVSCMNPCVHASNVVDTITWTVRDGFSGALKMMDMKMQDMKLMACQNLSIYLYSVQLLGLALFSPRFCKGQQVLMIRAFCCLFIKQIHLQQKLFVLIEAAPPL